MKPCTGNRRLIAWLAVGALEAEKAAKLREHIDRCEPCRNYWEEVSSVAHRLESAAPNSQLKASEAFYRRLDGKLQSVQPVSLGKWLEWNVRDWQRNWGLALAATVLVLLFGVTVVRHYSGPTPLAQTVTPTIPPALLAANLAPTVLNYQAIARNSLEQLDEVLTRQGNEPLPSAPIYAAVGVELASASF